MPLYLHQPESRNDLNDVYRQAFAEAVELLLVSAYLTSWDSTLRLNSECRSFRIIIGKDFGITKKRACEAVMRWLPGDRKAQFKVAEYISGFHPKALFWETADKRYFALVGSSNLTKAAFDGNYEANLYTSLSKAEFAAARKWVNDIERLSVPVSPDWLEQYREATVAPPRKRDTNQSSSPLHFDLSNDIGSLLRERREQLRQYEVRKLSILKLFRDCASGRVTSEAFFRKLPLLWSHEIGNRLQGKGWEILGKHSDLQQLSRSFVTILDAHDSERDDVVRFEIDRLKALHVASRGAFLSEMLCLARPLDYPILNYPVRKYLKSINFRFPRRATEGARYIVLASKLRVALAQAKPSPIRNLAELDAAIWGVYGRQ